MSPYWCSTALLAFLVVAALDLTSSGTSATQCDCDDSDQLGTRSGAESKSPLVYVDTDYGSKWIVILQRTDGKVNFDRNWAEYRNGFGTVGQDFWFGLERLHQLTRRSPYELAVEMTDFNGTGKFARYDRFEIGNEKHRYPIVNLGTHSGTAGDGLSLHKFVGFSTLDRETSVNCASYYGKGGWWYCGKSCYDSCLTGTWDTNSWRGIVWGKYLNKDDYTPIKTVKMMIRLIDHAIEQF